jgi:hypothetical protein
VVAEDRGGARLSAWRLNVHCGYFIYGFLNETSCAAPACRAVVERGVAGHINEGHDVRRGPVPARHRGRHRILGTAYAEAMSSTHCFRPIAPAIYLERRA